MLPTQRKRDSSLKGFKMESKIITLTAPCQKEIIDQMECVQQFTLNCCSPFLSLVNSSNSMIDVELRWANSNPNTVFVIAQEGSSIIGFAQGSKIHADQAPGFLRGVGARELCGDEYFYLDTVVVSPWHQKQGIGKKLIEQILNTQTCRNTLLWTQKDSAMFQLIIKMGGKVAWQSPPSGCFMIIPTGK